MRNARCDELVLPLGRAWARGADDREAGPLPTSQGAACCANTNSKWTFEGALGGANYAQTENSPMPCSLRHPMASRPRPLHHIAQLGAPRIAILGPAVVRLALHCGPWPSPSRGVGFIYAYVLAGWQVLGTSPTATAKLYAHNMYLRLRDAGAPEVLLRLLETLRAAPTPPDFLGVVDPAAGLAHHRPVLDGLPQWTPRSINSEFVLASWGPTTSQRRTYRRRTKRWLRRSLAALPTRNRH
ncbi:hypothetical protein C8Q79DRAFT_676578 [Trametes meyenii]|nr:hypothetical protein C8Q79DRAFT_676578 [Trametes meyenii]